MNLFSIVFLFLSTFTIAVSEQPGETTFGVKPSEQHLYDSKPFKCDSGSKILKQKQINDDYCDCKSPSDGSIYTKDLDGINYSYVRM